MKKLYVRVAVCIITVLLSSSVVYGAWKEKVTQNQIRVSEYVSLLQNGADPDTLERPYLRLDDHYQAKQSRKELADSMEEAEELARAGQHSAIPDPQFKIKGLSDEGAMEMFGQIPGKSGQP